MTESYERGTKSIIDLLDAQNSALVSDSQASNTVYNFLIDLMEIQRASGRFGFSLTEEQRQEWMQRFSDFAQTKGVVIQKQH